MSPTPNTPLSDDELGAMLGRSVRTKVDDIPTITPSFDGVERRARQITNRRRTATGLAVGALALFGGLGVASLLDGDDEGSLDTDVVTEPDTTDEDAVAIEDAEPDTDEPSPAPSIEDDGDESLEPESPLTDWVDPEVFGIVSIESDTNIDDVGPIAAPLIGYDENDTVWAATPGGDGTTALADLWQVDGIRGVRYLVDPDDPTDRNWLFDLGERIVHVDGTDRARVVADASTLVGAGLRLGRPTAYVADLPTSAGGAVEVGDIRIIDLRTGEAITLFAGVSTSDSVVREVVPGGEVTFVELGGVDGVTTLLGVDPATAPSGFGDAAAATLSTDGTTFFWLDQVDVGTDLRPRVELTIADLATGTVETVSAILPATQVALDYDLSPMGDQLLVGRSWPGGLENGIPSTSYAAPLLLDPATGEVVELGLPAGSWKPVAG